MPNKRHILLSLAALAIATLACNLSGSGSDTTPGTTGAPIVELLAPAPNSTFAEGVEVMLFAVAQIPDSRIARIEFRVDDVPIDEIAVPEAPADLLQGGATWTALGQSGHLITAEAFAENGASLGISDAAITVTGSPLAQLPAGNSVGGATGSDDPAATAVPTPTSNPAPPTALPGVPALVEPVSVNIRQGPGTNYPAVGTLSQSDAVQIVGRSTDSMWWAISYRGGTAWVFATLLIPQGDTNQLPLVAAP